MIASDREFVDQPDDLFLNAQLEAAKSELEALCDLVAEVPALMESSFKQRLEQQLSLNNALLDQQVKLLKLFKSKKFLLGSGEKGGAKSAPNKGSVHILRRARVGSDFSLLSSLLVNWANSLTRPLVLALGVFLIVVTSAIASYTHSNKRPALTGSLIQNRNSVGSPPLVETSPKSDTLIHSIPATSESLIELQASDSTWVEVSDVEGHPLLHDTLHAGEQRRIRLRRGLEVYAARPEQLRFRVDEGGWQSWPNAFFDTGLVLLSPSQLPVKLEGNW